MGQRLVKYDKKTERMMSDDIRIPDEVLEEVKRIAGVSPHDDGMGCYELSEEQVGKIANLFPFISETEKYDYFLEPN